MLKVKLPIELIGIKKAGEDYYTPLNFFEKEDNSKICGNGRLTNCPDGTITFEFLDKRK